MASSRPCITGGCGGTLPSGANGLPSNVQTVGGSPYFGTFNDLFAESIGTYLANFSYSSYTPKVLGEYPSSQNYDYDRFDAEVADHDPTTPSSYGNQDGENSVTDLLDKIDAGMPNYPNTDRNTCGCGTTTMGVDANGNCVECQSALDCDSLCNDVHAAAEGGANNATDFLGNLEEKTIENTTSGSFKDAVIRIWGIVRNKKSVRYNQRTFSLCNLDTGGLPLVAGKLVNPAPQTV